MNAFLDRLDQRLAAVRAAVATALPERVHASELKHFDDHPEADLQQGVLTIVSEGERDYRNDGLGMVAKEGTQELLFIGHLKAPNEDDAGTVVEAMELDLIEEIKGVLRTGVDGLSFALREVKHSKQQEKPYGWVVAFVDAGPPAHNIR